MASITGRFLSPQHWLVPPRPPSPPQPPTGSHPPAPGSAAPASVYVTPGGKIFNWSKNRKKVWEKFQGPVSQYTSADDDRNDVKLVSWSHACVTRFSFRRVYVFFFLSTKLDDLYQSSGTQVWFFHLINIQDQGNNLQEHDIHKLEHEQAQERNVYQMEYFSTISDY